MKEERMLENIGQVKEKFIEEAAPKGLLEEQQSVIQKKTTSYKWVKWGALAASMCIIAGLGLKMALPMFKPVDEPSPDEIDTNYNAVDTSMQSTDVIEHTTDHATANTEVLPSVPGFNPDEDVDTNIGTDFTSDQTFPDWGLNLSVENVTSTGLTLVVTQSGGNPTGELMTGEPYRLITLADGAWKVVEELPLPEGVDGRAWNSIGYPISKGETREFEINWEWMFGELPSGTYRLIKNFMDYRETANYDSADFWVEFEIK